KERPSFPPPRPPPAGKPRKQRKPRNRRSSTSTRSSPSSSRSAASRKRRNDAAPPPAQLDRRAELLAAVFRDGRLRLDWSDAGRRADPGGKAARLDKISHRRRTGTAREDSVAEDRGRNAEVVAQDALEDGPQVRRRLQVAAFVEVAGRQPRPIAKNLSAVHRPAGQQVQGADAVVGAFVSIRANRAAELCGADHHGLPPGRADTGA